MPDRIKVDDRFTIEMAPPTADRIAELAQEGYRSVVNLRTPGEKDEILSPDREGDIARKHGLDYLNVPVSPEAMNDATADQFDGAVAKLPGPVLIHCASGRRAGLFTLMHVARSEGLSGDEAIARAERLGFQFGTPEAREFFGRQVDRGQRHGGSRP